MSLFNDIDINDFAQRKVLRMIRQSLKKTKIKKIFSS
jgi:hypothetical protein